MELSTLQPVLIWPPLIVAWIASDAARELRDDLVTAMTRANVSRKDAAYYLRITEQQLSDQLALRQPTNFFRWADLPLTFWREFLIVRAHRTGQQVLEDDSALLKLVDAVQCLVAGAKKPMARMALPEAIAKKERA